MPTATKSGFCNAADDRRSSLGYFLAVVADWRQRRRLRAQPYALNDRMLKDIGISRREIDWIVNAPNRDATDRVVKSCR